MCPQFGMLIFLFKIPVIIVSLFFVGLVHAILFSTAWFPLEAGDFPVIYFIGGLGGYVPVELYSTVAFDIATHGFFVLGVDYKFPVYEKNGPKFESVGEDLDKYLQQYAWVR